MKLTKKVREQLLQQNEGFVMNTSYKGNNYRESRQYRIEGGELHIHSTGKGGAYGAVGGSQFDKDVVADDEQTHRFLYANLNALNTDGLE
jgi:hypothetical protein